MPLSIGVADSKLVLPWPVVLWATTVILALGGMIVQLQFTMTAQAELARQLSLHISGQAGDVMTERVNTMGRDLAEIKGKVEVMQQRQSGQP